MSTAPAARTRPSNRREMVVGAATELFATRGYENVGMSDVADGVGVRPSALYRHFANKESLLAEVFAAYVGSLCDALDSGAQSSGPPDAALQALIDAVLKDRVAGRLWIRESRYLPAEYSAEVRETLLVRLDVIVGSPDDGRRSRPRSVAVLGVVLSVALHASESTTPPMRDLLATLVRRAASGPLSPTEIERAAASPTGLPRVSKREQILAAAVDLFADRTYNGVGMEDIAAAVDLASSSIYNHFSSKGEILAVALHRGNGFIQVSLDDALAASDCQADALQAVVATYAGFAVRHPGMVQVTVSEAGELSEHDSGVLRDAQRGYIDEWVHLCTHLSEEDSAARRVTVMSTVTAINDLARSSPDSDEAFVATYGRQILGLPV
nr:TetR/AcrR family transcriptional regulator [Rhodococcus sp. (in: high G+C Gram-positive bacteria)]